MRALSTAGRGSSCEFGADDSCRRPTRDGKRLVRFAQGDTGTKPPQTCEATHVICLQLRRSDEPHVGRLRNYLRLDRGEYARVMAKRVHADVPEGPRESVHSGAEWRSELYDTACAQFARAADLLGLDGELRARLLEPRRSLVVNFPVRMDDGSVRNFTGYRAQHTLTVGPTKGDSDTRPTSRSANAPRWRC